MIKQHREYLEQVAITAIELILKSDVGTITDTTNIEMT